MNIIRTLLFILLVGALSFLQAFGFSVFGVKPNLALAVLIAISFFIANLWEGFLLVLLAALILKFAPGFEKGILTFSLIAAAGLIVKKYLPWRYFLSNLILIGIGTFIFYLFLNPNLIISVIFLKEIVLNLVAGIIIFAFLSFLWENK